MRFEFVISFEFAHEGGQETVFSDEIVYSQDTQMFLNEEDFRATTAELFNDFVTGKRDYFQYLTDDGFRKTIRVPEGKATLIQAQGRFIAG
jgi:hypothetical protein